MDVRASLLAMSRLKGLGLLGAGDNYLLISLRQAEITVFQGEMHTDYDFSFLSLHAQQVCIRRDAAVQGSGRVWELWT